MLTLPTKKKWFDMIKTGEKMDEYRKDTPYYARRFDRFLGQAITLRLRNGYGANRPTLECLAVVKKGIGGRPEWGAEPSERYYIVHILAATQV